MLRISGDETGQARLRRVSMVVVVGDRFASCA